MTEEQIEWWAEEIADYCLRGGGIRCDTKVKLDTHEESTPHKMGNYHWRAVWLRASRLLADKWNRKP